MQGRPCSFAVGSASCWGRLRARRSDGRTGRACDPTISRAEFAVYLRILPAVLRVPSIKNRRDCAARWSLRFCVERDFVQQSKPAVRLGKHITPQQLSARTIEAQQPCRRTRRAVGTGIPGSQPATGWRRAVLREGADNAVVICSTGCVGVPLKVERPKMCCVCSNVQAVGI